MGAHLDGLDADVGNRPGVLQSVGTGPPQGKTTGSDIEAGSALRRRGLQNIRIFGHWASAWSCRSRPVIVAGLRRCRRPRRRLVTR